MWCGLPRPRSPPPRWCRRALRLRRRPQEPRNLRRHLRRSLRRSLSRILLPLHRSLCHSLRHRRPREPRNMRSSFRRSSLLPLHRSLRRSLRSNLRRSLRHGSMSIKCSGEWPQPEC
jgi:hypothetical protein